MTDYEISRRLALAIGWPETRIVDGHNTPRVIDDAGWVRYFNYADPAVIWPISERLNCFPYALRDNQKRLTGEWNAWASDGEDIQADTAAKAVALAVIKAKNRQ